MSETSGELIGIAGMKSNQPSNAHAGSVAG